MIIGHLHVIYCSRNTLFWHRLNEHRAAGRLKYYSTFKVHTSLYSLKNETHIFAFGKKAKELSAIKYQSSRFFFTDAGL